MDTLKRLFESHSRVPNPMRIEALLSAIEDTYSRPASEIPRIALWGPALSLASLYTARGNPRKAIEFGLKGLESLGYVIEGGQIACQNRTKSKDARLVVKKWGLLPDTVTMCWMNLSSSYRDLAPKLRLADQAEEYAKMAYRMCVDEDETFGDTYSRYAS